MKVLLVEDNEALRESAKTFLESEGHEVIPAINGFNGLAMWYAEDRKFDLIITDIEMPEMDGFMMIDEIRDECYTPICVWSGKKDNLEFERKFRESGANWFIAKTELTNFLKENFDG